MSFTSLKKTRQMREKTGAEIYREGCSSKFRTYPIDKGVYGFIPHDLARLNFAKGGLITKAFGGSLARPRTVSARIRIKIFT
jgi:hypothetical protein